ncbi:MAG: DUF2203 domain-containing protein [Ardenticatenaceae bacterium]|nr:DUF2203 domain-containing protein [Ardenticatenaceae bacterium]
MGTKYFTVDEANALLPQIEPIMARLLEKRARAVEMYQQIEPLLADLHLDIGGPTPTQMALDFVEIGQLIQQLQAMGCVVKDINVGLLDFLCDRDGRDVYLCWRYGEPEISFYHDLHTGFNGRQSV